MSYLAYNNGLNLDLVGSNYVPKDGEVLFINVPTEEELSIAFPDYLTKKQIENNENTNNVIIQQIQTLEEKQHRAVRDFILTGDKTRIQEIENQIVVLRNSLR